MRYVIVIFINLIAALALNAQNEIKIEDAAKHVGDSVKICAKAYSIRYMEQAKGAPTLINMGAAYPNQLLTVVILDEQRKEYETMPEVLFKDKEICITGRIELFRDKPEIVIRTKEQIILQ